MNSAIGRYLISMVMFTAIPGFSLAQNLASCYSALISSRPPSLSAWVVSLSANGTVVFDAGDSMSGSAPPQWTWGDGTTTSGWTPLQHTYSNTSQNYVVSVSIVDRDNTTQYYSVPVFFVAPTFTKQTFPGISFQIPSQPITFQTHWPYAPPSDVTYFNSSAFPAYSSGDVAYILQSLSSIDYAFANSNSFLVNGVFSIDMLEDTDGDAGESYWYTTPMSVGYAPAVVDPSSGEPTPQWYILFNEIGKDTTLNSPASLTFGGNTDGDASEIYSETMGDIFSYAAGCQLISNAASYGIGPDATADIRNSMLAGAANLQQAYNTYVSDGAPFSSWNPNNGGTDPTLGTVSTLAWEFIENAETQGQGYQIPLTRMMKLLQMFDPSMLTAYSPGSNTEAGATFRSTLMVTALSYAFQGDLRSQFEALNFPIDNTTYEALYQLASGTPLTPTVTATPSSSSITTNQALTIAVAVTGSTTWLPTPTGTVTLTSGSFTSTATPLSGGSATINVPAGSLATGSDTLTVSYTPDSASSSTYSSASGTAPLTVNASTGATVTPTVTVVPSASSVTTVQALSVTVTVSGGTGNPTPTGSVTLTGPGYTSASTTLTSGAATISVPAGSLSMGIDTLTASYAADSTSSAIYNSATGTATVTVMEAQAQTQYAEKVLYKFSGGSDGGQPYAGLISDAKGNLYGTTKYGGDLAACPVSTVQSFVGCGIVFELSPPPSGIGPWMETVLHTFTGGSDGASPVAGVILDASGNLYGTTLIGGTNSSGTVFKLSLPSDSSGPWTETVLYNFMGGTDGAGPNAGLILSASGNLYGTTTGGGSSGNGTVFELSQPSNGGTAWTEAVLYSFTGGTDGANPVAGVVLDKSGNLYGTTSNGGAASASCAGECGSVFELAAQSNGGWLENTLYSFQGNTDGLNPLGGVIFDESGDLYGTTSGFFPIVGGNVFELTPASNTAWIEAPAYTFQGVLANGWTPESGLIFDQFGNLYGTTAFGGSSAGSANCIGNGTIGVPNGCGTVFELSPGSTGGWAERVLYNFQGNTDGGYPEAALILDSEGNLYGTTTSFGTNNGYGVVFELSPITSGTAPTTTSLSLAPASVPAGSSGPVVMTAIIAPASGTGVPTGIVGFFSGSTQIGVGTLSGGAAAFSFNPSNLSAGTYTITAKYTGDSTFAASTSTAQTLTVSAKPTYTMSATAVTVSPGSPGTSSITISSSNGYVGTVMLTCAITSSPAGAVDMPTCTSAGTVTLSSSAASESTTVTVNTTAASSASATRPKFREKQEWREASEGAVLALLVLFGIPARSRKCRSTLGILTLAVLISTVSACGGGGGNGGTGTTQSTNPGTTAGSYTITVTGTGNGSAKTTATTTFTLTVN
jgi:uncharacterized repeat protein (TIGR03803 family)